MKTKFGLKPLLRVVMAAFIAAPILLASVFGFVSISSFVSKSTAERANRSAYAQTTGVSAVFASYISSLTAASNLDAVHKAASDNNYNSDAGKETDALIESFKNADGSILDILVTNAKGEILNGDKPGDVTDVQLFNPTGVYVSDISESNSVYGGKNTFYCAKAITDGEVPVGYIILTADLTKITDYLKNTGYMNKGNLIVFDGKGAALNLNGDVITQPVNIKNNTVKTKFDELKNKKDAFETFESGGYFGSYGVIPSTNSWLWMGIYPSSAVSPFSSFALAIVAVVVVCLIDAIIVIFSTRNIVNPMTNMIGKMNVIKEGNKGERFDVTGRNEFAVIAETFNVMLDEVVMSEQLHRTISDISDNILFEWDFVKEMMYVSDNFKNTFDIDVRGATLMNGRFLDSKMDEANAEKYKREMNRLLQSKESVGSEFHITTKNGVGMWISLRAHCVTDRLNELVRILGVITNIDNEKKMTLQLSEKASYDFLSQLYNRSTFERELEAELGRRAGKKLAVIFLDVDDFKFINDRYNHSVGDEVIKFVSDVLKSRVTESGFAGRFGGDEFVMCITNESQLEDIEQFSMDIIDELHDGYYCEQADETLNVHISIGITLSPRHGTDGKTLVAYADEAMYFVKKNGKANYHFFDPEDSNIIEMM